MKIVKTFGNRKASSDGSIDVGKIVLGIIVTSIVVVLMINFMDNVYNPSKDIIQETSEKSIQRQNESIKGR